jgi:hypothetical protein
MIRKIAIVLAVLVLVAVGGYFGVTYWATHRAAAEVEATFEALRQQGATASHGEVRFDLVSRTLVVADIAIGQPDAPYAVAFRVGRLTASGVGQPGPGKLSADRIELIDVTSDAKPTALSVGTATYQMPRIEVLGYAGPAAFLLPGRGASLVDSMRVQLKQMVAVTAASVSVPTATASVQPADLGKAPQLAGPVVITYSGILARDIRDGRVAGLTVDKTSFALPQIPGGENIMFEVGKIAVADANFGGLMAALDPPGASADAAVQMYRQIGIGTVKMTFGPTGGMVLDAITVDDVGFKPAKLHFGDFMKAVETMQAMPGSQSLDQIREFMNRMADFYDAVHMGKIELRGLAIATPNGDAKLAAIRLDGLDDGRLAELAVEGLQAKSPQGPVSFDRVALNGLHIADMVRLAGRAAALGPGAPADNALLALRLIEGFAVARMDIPTSAGERALIETLSAGWGQFVGLIPTSVRIKLAATMPVSKDDPRLAPVRAAGVTSVTLRDEVEASWNESTKTLAISPLVLDVDKVMSVSAVVSVLNVPRAIFSTDPAVFGANLVGVEAGPIELIVRDAGALDLVVGQLAKEKKLSIEDARKAIALPVSTLADQAVAQHAELKPLADAVVEFLQTPKATLRIKLSPKGRTPVMQLAADGKTDPFAPLERFNIEVVLSR